MIKRKTTLLIAFSALLALGAAWIANNWAITRTVLQAHEDENNVHVLVAAMDIDYGQKIEEKHLKAVLIPKKLTVSNAFTNKEELIGKVANTAQLKGDILRKERFANHLEGSTLAAMISKKKRAITVRVDDVVGVAGFLLPGNRVDILATKTNRSRKKVETDTILRDIKVLAVDQTAATDKSEPVIVRAVTLEMTPSQAEQLVKARDEGRIQLALRNPLDNQVEEPEPPKQVKKVAKSKVYPYRRITVIRGTDVSLVTR